ncbi:MAG: hypothetical protein ACI8UO_001210 [Verrucomicrobiales bacterium]|jgi:hypothetical protein
MSNFNWETTFLDLFTRSLERYKGGDENVDGYFTDEDLEFLKSIGYKPVEFFDYVEDIGDGAQISPATAVMIAAVRRDYLDAEQKGELSDHEIKPAELTPKNGELGGVRWLPRIIEKAEGKLRGELDPDIMFCCGGDRAFLSEHDIHPADFLRVVWAAKGDKNFVLNYVQNH